jgi:mRNA interferase MazF
MVIRQGDVWWADLGEPVGSAPGFRRPVVVVQGNAINDSRISTVICIPLTSNLKWATAPGNLSVPASMTGLDRDSVAHVSLIVALDRSQLTERVGQLDRPLLERVLSGLDVVLGR